MASLMADTARAAGMDMHAGYNSRRVMSITWHKFTGDLYGAAQPRYHPMHAPFGVPL